MEKQWSMSGVYVYQQVQVKEQVKRRGEEACEKIAQRGCARIFQIALFTNWASDTFLASDDIHFDGPKLNTSQPCHHCCH